MKVWSKQDLHITRAIGAIDGDLSASALLDRMEANGCPRGSGYLMVQRAVGLGLLFRSGTRMAFTYRINTNYVAPERKYTPPPARPVCKECGRPTPRPRAKAAPKVAAPPQEKKPEHEIRPPHNGFTIVASAIHSAPDAFAGLALDRTALRPHLGTPICDHDELTPAEGMRYCDATRRIFRHAFTE